MNGVLKNKLIDPERLKEALPLSAEGFKAKRSRDEEIRAVLTGQSHKLIVIIGPCSADYENSVMDYVQRLAIVQKKVSEKLILLPRVFTSKPRTNCSGYKGLLHKKDPRGNTDFHGGVVRIRHLHRRIIEETGLTCADEILYPEMYSYLSDLLSYTTIGARSVEDQQHRFIASASDSPVGMKNPTSGNLDVMLNSIYAAQQSHTFEYRGWEVMSRGNPLAHAVLRGGIDWKGINHPNYHYEDLQALYEKYLEKNLKNPAVLVDANHGNSNKNYLEQIRICRSVLLNRASDERIRRILKGFMIESYIEDGNQPPDGQVYGKSITDGCLGWEKSEKLIYEIANFV